MKIDKYFIDKLLETDLDKAITSDIISMAHKLGHCTVAEGVEYESQMRYLKEHGCDRIQGYLLSKPLAGEDALEFLKNTGVGSERKFPRVALQLVNRLMKQVFHSKPQIRYHRFPDVGNRKN